MPTSHPCPLCGYAAELPTQQEADLYSEQLRIRISNLDVALKSLSTGNYPAEFADRAIITMSFHHIINSLNSDDYIRIFRGAYEVAL